MDEEIGGHRQKSAYICDAIEKKLSKDSKCMILRDHPTIEILQAARFRCEQQERFVLSDLLREFIEELQDAS